MSLHISDIEQWYQSGHYTYQDTSSKEERTKLPETYVFDEDLSVKRNREMVAEHNAKVEELRTVARMKQQELNNKLTEDVVAYIKEYYNLKKERVLLIL